MVCLVLNLKSQMRMVLKQTILKTLEGFFRKNVFFFVCLVNTVENKSMDIANRMVGLVLNWESQMRGFDW